MTNISVVKKKSRTTALLQVFGAIVVAGFVVSHMGNFLPKPTPDPVKDAMVAALQRDNNVRLAGETAVRSILKDSSSAQFSGSMGWRRHGEDVACGYVNARNGFGAMGGNVRWVYRARSGEADIETMGDRGETAQLWNRLCVGQSDDLKVPPDQFLGQRLGSRPGPPLHAYDATRKAWVFGDGAKRAYLGVDMIEPTYMIDGGHIFGARATASGKPAYDTLRQKLFEQFGVPTDDSPYQRQETKWDWGRHRVVIDLTYSADHDQTTLAINQQD